MERKETRTWATYLVRIVSKSHQVDISEAQHTFVVLLAVKDVIEPVVKIRCGRVKVVEFL